MSTISCMIPCERAGAQADIYMCAHTEGLHFIPFIHSGVRMTFVIELYHVLAAHSTYIIIHAHVHMPDNAFMTTAKFETFNSFCLAESLFTTKDTLVSVRALFSQTDAELCSMESERELYCNEL